MKAWAIFSHAVAQVLDNLGQALRLSAALYAVQAVLGLALGLWMGRNAGALPAAEQGDPAAVLSMVSAALPALLVLVIVGLWVAVAWHQLRLAGKASAGLVPLFDGGRMLAYFGASLGIALILVPVALAANLALVSLVSALGLGDPAALLPGGGGALLRLPVDVVLGALGLRLLSVLPGFALKPGHRLTEGWQATRGQMGDFLALSVLTNLALLALGLVGTALAGALPILSLAWGIVGQWLAMMVGVSLLTTLYSHYLLKRPLA